MKKAVLLAPIPPPYGGIAAWTERMMNADIRQGWEIAVVDEQVSKQRGLFGNAKKRDFSDEWKRCVRIWKDLKQALKDENAVVVHSCIPSTTFAMLRECVCAEITRKSGRKFITHFRCTVPNMRTGRMWDIMLKKLCDKSDYIINLNEQAQTFVKKYTDTPMCIIPNFTSESEIRSDSKEIKEEISRVLYVGGGIATKGCMEFIDMAAEFPEIEFRICGNCSDDIKEYAKKAGNVICVGVKDRAGVREELQNADVFAFLTYFRGEGFSNALAEAMAAGLPCIVTDWAANKDMIEDKGGCVVPIRDSKAAVEALKTMLPADVRKAQSEFNVEKVKRCYTEGKVIGSYLDLYEKIIKG